MKKGRMDYKTDLMLKGRRAVTASIQAMMRSGSRSDIAV